MSREQQLRAEIERLEAEHERQRPAMRGLVTISLILLCLLAGACRDAHAPCAVSTECLENEVCVAALCRTVCAESADCPAAETCLSGACMPAGQFCDDQGDCLDSEVCREGRCRSRCTEDRDCAAQALCIAGVCLPWSDAGSGDDAANADAVTSDAGMSDVSAADTGAADTGVPDAGAPDAAPPSPRPVYRSVGPGNTDPLASGAGNPLDLQAGVATFTSPLPARVGVGDALLVDADDDAVMDTPLFIHGRGSATSYQLRDAAGLVPAAALSASETWALYRAYTSLYDAERGEENAGIAAALRDFDPWADGKDLVVADQVWNIACYADAADLRAGTVTLDGWTTSPSRYLRIYTPVASSEVGARQRHAGAWDSAAYQLVRGSAGTVLNNDAVDHLRVEGLQLRQDAPGGSGFRGFWSEHAGATADVRFSHNIIQGPALDSGADLAWGIEHYDNHATSVHRFWNNIIYDTGEVGNSAGVRLLGDPGSGVGVVYLNSNTIARTSTAIGTYLFAGTVVAKNNLAIGDGFSGSYDPRSSSNAAADGSAPGADPVLLSSGSVLDYCVSDSDLHIAPAAAQASELLGAGADLSADPALAFDDDIDGDLRAGAWDVGADQAP